jgi:uncharacterized protein (DUF1330 family)
MGPDIVRYLEGIDATLAPYQGRFIIHGDQPEVLEGTWFGDLIMIEFPDGGSARAWYASEAYRAIQPLRARNSVGLILFIGRVSAAHQATDILQR